MQIRSKLMVVVFFFGFMPLVSLFWFAGRTGLEAHNGFQYAMTMTLIGTILVGLFTPGLVKRWIFGSKLENMQQFCQAVKEGRYDVHLPVGNSTNDQQDENEWQVLMRHMNWMAHCIKVNAADLQQAVDHLRESQQEIRQQRDELKQAQVRQLAVQAQLERKTQDLSEVVGKIRNLLDNAGQGFLTFAGDLKVAGEYSAECVMLFNREIGGEFVPALFYPGDEQQQNFLKALFNKIFKEEDTFLRDNYISLLPEEILLGDTYIKAAYKLIQSPLEPYGRQILLILTDVTEQRCMAEQIEQERNILSMVVHAVTGYHEFSKARQDYGAFCREELPAMLASSRTAAERVDMIFRAVHTWKGIFAQLDMQTLAARLHELESQLEKLRNLLEDDLAEFELTRLFTRYSQLVLYGWLEDEIRLLTNVLGERFFQEEDKIIIEAGRLKQLEERVLQILPAGQAKRLLSELRRLRYKPFTDLLQRYPEYTLSLAERYNKLLRPVIIQGQPVWLDPDRYYDFAKTLIHVFRNAVAHGLETPEERLAMGKEEWGRISCSIREEDGRLVVAISDDGRGMDELAIKEVAIQKGVARPEQLQGLSREETLRLVLADRFSSAATVDELAGRGVGLSAVLEEVNRLGGQIHIVSEEKKGTTFTFVLPLEPLEPPEGFDVAFFAEQLQHQIGRYLSEEYRIQVEAVQELAAECNMIPMQELSSFIDFQGAWPGRVMFSSSAGFARQLAGDFLPDGMAAEEQQMLVESVFSEVCNTIAGNTLQLLPGGQVPLSMGTPVTIWAEGASAKYAAAAVRLWQIRTDAGPIALSLISLAKEREDAYGASTGGR